MTECCLSFQKERIIEIKLIDTNSSVYTVMNECLVEEFCKKLNIESMLLLKLCSVQSFNDKLINQFIIHAIYLKLTVNEHSELSAFMLIIRLDSHQIILGKS